MINISLEINLVMERINVGLIGYGAVGSGFSEYFYSSKNPQLEQFKITAIGVNNLARERNFPMTYITTNALDDIARNVNIDVVIDAVGGDEKSNEASLHFIEQALTHGKHVITANKNNLAQHLPRLTALAEENKVNLEYEASVCGCIPVIQTMKEYYAHDRIKKIVGIFNGTSNYILSQMHKGRTYSEALAEAQANKYAEADPTADVSGKDAADKLAILASLAFGINASPKNVTIEGIENIDKDDFFYVRDNLRLRTGKYHTIKLLAIAEAQGDRLDLRVHPAYIGEEHPIYGVDGALNAVCIYGEYGKMNVLKGVGAGSIPTGFAVASDLIKIGKKIERNIVDNCLVTLHPKTSVQLEDRLIRENRVSQGYIKSSSPEHLAGVLAQKAHILAKYGLSVIDWFNFNEQETGDPKEILPDTFLIESACERMILPAIDELSKHEYCTTGKVTYVRSDLLSDKNK